MTPNQAVLKVIAALERHGIAYMMVGSYSSNEHGVARSTMDADIVIEMDNADVAAVFRDVLPEVRFDPQLRLESVTLTPRYVGKLGNGEFKIELFAVNGNDPFDVMRFSRRRAAPFLGGTAYLQTAEDVVVQKLRWFSIQRRMKDIEDAKVVLAVQWDRCDHRYIGDWCEKVGASAVLDQLRQELQERLGLPKQG